MPKPESVIFEEILKVIKEIQLSQAEVLHYFPELSQTLSRIEAALTEQGSGGLGREILAELTKTIGVFLEESIAKGKKAEELENQAFGKEGMVQQLIDSIQELKGGMEAVKTEIGSARVQQAVEGSIQNAKEILEATQTEPSREQAEGDGPEKAPPLGLFEGLNVIELSLGGVSIVTFSFYSSEIVEQLHTFLPNLEQSTILHIYTSLYFVFPVLSLVFSIIVLNTRNGFYHQLGKYKLVLLAYLGWCCAFVGIVLSDLSYFDGTHLPHLLALCIVLLVSTTVYQFRRLMSSTIDVRKLKDNLERIYLAKRQLQYGLVIIILLTIAYYFVAFSSYQVRIDEMSKYAILGKSPKKSVERKVFADEYDKFYRLKENFSFRGTLMSYSNVSRSADTSLIADSARVATAKPVQGDTAKPKGQEVPVLNSTVDAHTTRPFIGSKQPANGAEVRKKDSTQKARIATARKKDSTQKADIIARFSFGSSQVNAAMYQNVCRLDSTNAATISTFLGLPANEVNGSNLELLFNQCEILVRKQAYQYVFGKAQIGFALLVSFLILCLFLWYEAYKERLMDPKRRDEYQEVNIFRAHILIGIMLIVPVINRVSVPGFKTSEPLFGKKEDLGTPDDRPDITNYFQGKPEFYPVAMDSVKDDNRSVENHYTIIYDSTTLSRISLDSIREIVVKSRNEGESKGPHGN